MASGSGQNHSVARIRNAAANKTVSSARVEKEIRNLAPDLSRPRQKIKGQKITGIAHAKLAIGVLLKIWSNPKVSIEPKTIPKPTISWQANSDLLAKVKNSELPANIWSVSTITESVEVQKLTSEISSIRRINDWKIKRVLPCLINCAKLVQLIFEN